MQNPWKDIVPYTKEEAARFKGRDEDIRKFSRILLYSDFSVLYAESGIGKTSFINAGIIPVFAASHYKDAIIQIPTDIYSTPVEKFRERFEELLCNRIFEKSGLQEVTSSDCPNSKIQDDLRKSLWWRLHAYTYKTTRNGQEQNVEPFIIFDQFEEVFQKASPEILNELFRVLADLSIKMPPKDLMGKLKAYNRDELYDQIDTDIHFKVLFSLRKEYLAEFDHWTNTRYAIPEMLQNRMLLQSFTRQQAEEVITEQVLNGNAVDTLDLVKDNILSLFERRNTDGQSNIVRQNAGYEAFLLSVICSRLYDFAQAKGIAQVTPKEMAGFNISSLILNFYEASIRDLSIPRQHLRVIEEELVDEWGERNRIKANARNLASIRFAKRYRKGLEDKHIIKNSDGYVELIHDRVAEAIFYKRKEINKNRWAWLQRVALAVLIVLLSCAAIYSGWITENPQGYKTSELRWQGDLKLPKDRVDYDKWALWVTKLTIDNDDTTMSMKQIGSNHVNLTDLEITGQEARPTNIMVTDCSKLVNLSLSDSLTSFPQVWNCPNLHFLRLPANVDSFPESSLFLLRMDSVEFAIPEKTPASDKYVWQDGILWSIADTCIIYAQTNADTVLCFPDGIHAESLKYGERTFSQPKNKKPDLLIKGRELVSVKLYDNTTLNLTQPRYDTIETIGEAVFRNCKKLQTVKLPSKLKTIESHAFAGCTALSEIKLPNSTEVEDYAFAGCHRLKRVYLSQGSCFTEFTNICSHLNWYTQFDDCDSVTFVLPDASAPNKFSKDENGVLWYDREPIFFNEVPPTCNHENSLYCIRNGVVYRRGDIGALNKHKVTNIPWSASPKANTEHIIENLNVANIKYRLYKTTNASTTFIINADSTEYVPSASYIFFRNPQKLTELHLPHCNYADLPRLALSDLDKSRITLYVPWGCRKYYEADSEYAAFKEIREDSWLCRLNNLLTDMWQASKYVDSANPILGYIGIGIVLLVLGVIYYLRFKNLASHNSDNRSRNVLRWQAALTTVSTVFFFVLAWTAVYWLVFFNWGIFNWGTFCLFHILGIAFGILVVRIVVFNITTDWTALIRNIRNLVARIRHMTWQEWRQLFVDLTKAFLSCLARAIRRAMARIKIILLLLISVMMIILIVAFGIHWHRWSQEGSETINQLDGNEENESALYNKLSGRLMLLTPKQKGQLQDYYVNYNRINTPYKILDSIRIGKGHANDVNSANFSPDGKYIVTASWDNTAIVWDANTGDTIRTLNKHRGSVNSAYFSPDGEYIVTASNDNKAIVWNANSRDTIRTLNKHRDWVKSANFSSPDGKYIVTASDDDTAIVWDANTGDTIRTLKHRARVYSANFSPDGKYIVTASYDNKVIVWNAHTGDTIRTLKHRARVYSANFSPDGKYIVTASSWDRSAIVWNANTGDTIRTLNKHRGSVNSATFSPDGKYIVTASSDNTAIVWDANTGTPIRTLNKHRYGVNSANFSSDGKYIVTASDDNSAIVWDANTGDMIRSLWGIRSSNILRCAPDGSCLVAAAPYDENKAFLLNRSGVVTDTLNHAAEIDDILFCPNAEQFVTIGGDKVLVWDKRGERRDSLHHVGVTDVSFSADGKRMISSSYKEMRAWDQSGTLVDSLEKLDRSNIVYHLGAKRKIAVENADSLVFVYDLLKGDSLVLDKTRYMDGVESVCISPDGKHIITAIDPMEDKEEVKAIVWSPDGTFEQELKYNSNYASISDISYSWNGRYILGRMSGDCFVWDADSGMLLWRIDGDVMDIETAKSIDANRELTFVTREKDIKRVRLLSLKEIIEMRRRQLNTER